MPLLPDARESGSWAAGPTDKKTTLFLQHKSIATLRSTAAEMQNKLGNLAQAASMSKLDPIKTQSNLPPQPQLNDIRKGTVQNPPSPTGVYRAGDPCGIR